MLQEIALFRIKSESGLANCPLISSGIPHSTKMARRVVYREDQPVIEIASQARPLFDKSKDNLHQRWAQGEKHRPLETCL